MVPLGEFVKDFAEAIAGVDASRSVWANSRTGDDFQAGVGPHSEAATLQLVVEWLGKTRPQRYASARLNVPYPASRQKCDLVIDDPPIWAIEAKLLRLLGDNGKPNDNMLMHILSPYAAHRSALTDCEKLLEMPAAQHASMRS